MRLYLGSLAAVIALVSAQQAASAEPADRTGLCARKVEWLNKAGEEQHILETVISHQSAHIENDVKRKAEYEREVGRPYLPDMKPYVWIGIWVSDAEMTEVDGPDCSMLPSISER